MEYRDLVRDFAARTRVNLEAIERLHGQCADRQSDGAVFEVTQLCNSLLGLIVLPQQTWFDQLPTTPLRDLPDPRWASLTMRWERKHTRGPQKGQLRNQTFKELAIVLRNAIAHFNIKFTATNERISGLKLWNYPSDEARQLDQRDFELDLTLSELRWLAFAFIDELQRGNGP